MAAALPELTDAVIAHLAARDALEGAAADKLTVDDPRFAAVADTLAALRAAVLNTPA